MGLFANFFNDKGKSRANQCCEIPQNRILRYKVIGKNPATNRQKTVKNIILGSWQSPSDDMKIDGIEPPYQFILDLPPLTDGQMDVFKRNGICVPEGMHREDAKAVIMHIVMDGEFEHHPYFEPPLPISMLEEAVEKQMFMPSFLSEHEARLFLDGKNWRIDL